MFQKLVDFVMGDKVRQTRDDPIQERYNAYATWTILRHIKNPANFAHVLRKNLVVIRDKGYKLATLCRCV